MIQQPILQPIQQPFCDRASQCSGECSGNGVERSWLGHGVAVSKAFVKSLIPMEDPRLNINPYKTLQDIVRVTATAVLPASTILFVVKDIADACSASGLPEPDAKESPQESKATGEEARGKEPGSKVQQPSTVRYQGSQGAKALLALGTLASSFQSANSKSIADGSQPTYINGNYSAPLI